MTEEVLCACGCGETRPKRDRRYQQRRYIKGHQRRGSGRKASELGILFDACDAALVEPFSWCLAGGYPARGINNRIVKLHNILMRPEPGFEVDHINRNRLDCRRENLRIVTKTENRQNQGLRRDNSSGFRGVYRQRKRWVARIFTKGQYLRVGLFDDPAEADKAVRAARLKLMPGATD